LITLSQFSLAEHCSSLHLNQIDQDIPGFAKDASNKQFCSVFDLFVYRSAPLKARHVTPDTFFLNSSNRVRSTLPHKITVETLGPLKLIETGGFPVKIVSQAHLRSAVSNQSRHKNIRFSRSVHTSQTFLHLTTRLRAPNRNLFNFRLVIHPDSKSGRDG
jgi:hypothetical protein